MFVVVCYDIRDNRRRNRVAKLLEGYGARVQKSVFECDLTLKQLSKMRERLQRRLKLDEDLARLYSLCEADVRRVCVLGKGDVYRARDVYIV